MPLIPEQVLDDIQSRTDIAELIGRYLPLKRVGRHFKALCPFHQERTPSFYVNTEKQIFHCFGCGAGGNVFGFLMQQERLTFPEAVKQLAEHAGVEVEAWSQAPQDGKREQCLDVLEKACRFYERLLEHPQHGRSARDYVRRRGISDETRRAFRIGAAADGWEHLIQAARRTGVGEAVLAEAGLTVAGKRGPIDRFRSRVLFPIQDARGRVVAFGGRSLAGQEPKYLNSPETPVYQKGRHLFGLAQAKEAILKERVAVVVEGYFDCVLLWQAGIRHVVSPLGTAFTPEQARLLGRYAHEVVLAFDADAAGEQATVRGIDLLVEQGFSVRVAQLPPGVDPDEVVLASGPEAFHQLVGSAVNVIEFLMALASKRFPLRSPEGKARAAQLVLSTVVKIPDPIMRDEYQRLLAQRWQVDEAAVAAALQRMTSGSRSARSAEREPRIRRAAGETASQGAPQGAERILAALIIDQPSRWDRVKGQPVLEAVRDARLRRLLGVVSELRATSAQEPTLAQVVSRLTEEGMGPLVSELAQLANTVSAKDRALEECVPRLIGEARKRQLEGLREQIRQMQQAGQPHAVTELLHTYQRLMKALPVAPAGG